MPSKLQHLFSCCLGQQRSHYVAGRTPMSQQLVAEESQRPGLKGASGIPSKLLSLPVLPGGASRASSTKTAAEEPAAAGDIHDLLDACSVPHGPDGELRVVDLSKLKEQYDASRHPIAVLLVQPGREGGASIGGGSLKRRGSSEVAALEDLLESTAVSSAMHLQQGELKCWYVNDSAVTFNKYHSTEDFKRRIEAQMMQGGLQHMMEALIRHCQSDRPMVVRQFLPTMESKPCSRNARRGSQATQVGTLLRSSVHCAYSRTTSVVRMASTLGPPSLILPDSGPTGRPAGPHEAIATCPGVHTGTTACNSASGLQDATATRTRTAASISTTDNSFVMLEVSVCLAQRSGSVCPALFLHYSPAFQQSRTALCAQLKRDNLALGHIPSLITIFSLDGRVVHQNAKSIAYMGFAQGQMTAGSGDGISDPRHPLRSLFSLEPDMLDDMWETLLDGSEWQGRVRMPAHVNLEPKNPQPRGSPKMVKRQRGPADLTPATTDLIPAHRQAPDQGSAAKRGEEQALLRVGPADLIQTAGQSSEQTLLRGGPAAPRAPRSQVSLDPRLQGSQGPQGSRGPCTTVAGAADAGSSHLHAHHQRRSPMTPQLSGQRRASVSFDLPPESQETHSALFVQSRTETAVVSSLCCSHTHAGHQSQDDSHQHGPLNGMRISKEPQLSSITDLSPAASGQHDILPQRSPHLDAVQPCPHLDAVQPCPHLDAVQPCPHLDAVQPSLHVNAVQQVAVHSAVQLGTVNSAVQQGTANLGPATKRDVSECSHAVPLTAAVPLIPAVPSGLAMPCSPTVPHLTATEPSSALRSPTTAAASARTAGPLLVPVAPLADNMATALHNLSNEAIPLARKFNIARRRFSHHPVDHLEFLARDFVRYNPSLPNRQPDQPDFLAKDLGTRLAHTDMCLKQRIAETLNQDSGSSQGIEKLLAKDFSWNNSVGQSSAGSQGSVSSMIYARQALARALQARASVDMGVVARPCRMRRASTGSPAIMGGMLLNLSPRGNLMDTPSGEAPSLKSKPSSQASLQSFSKSFTVAKRVGRRMSTMHTDLPAATRVLRMANYRRLRRDRSLSNFNFEQGSPRALSVTSEASAPGWLSMHSEQDDVMLSSALVQEEGEEEGEEHSEEGAVVWFDVEASRFEDPATGDEVVLLVQTDVTQAVKTEQVMQRILDAEHALLEQVFPKHVLEVMAVDRAQQQAVVKSGISSESPLVTAPSNADSLARSHKEVTILFADIVTFTNMCQELEAVCVMRFLNQLFSQFDEMVAKHDVYKVETIGDCYMVAGGLLTEDECGTKTVKDGYVDPDHARKVFAFAIDMLRIAASTPLPTTGKPVQIRVGLHSGPVVSGVVGTRMPRFCLFGDTVNTASRMESTSQPGRIHVSAAARAAIGDPPPHGGVWRPTGGVPVKGKGIMETYLYQPQPSSSQEKLIVIANTAAAAAAVGSLPGAAAATLSSGTATVGVSAAAGAAAHEPAAAAADSMRSSAPASTPAGDGSKFRAAGSPAGSPAEGVVSSPATDVVTGLGGATSDWTSSTLPAHRALLRAKSAHLAGHPSRLGQTSFNGSGTLAWPMPTCDQHIVLRRSSDSVIAGLAHQHSSPLVSEVETVMTVSRENHAVFVDVDSKQTSETGFETGRSDSGSESLTHSALLRALNSPPLQNVAHGQMQLQAAPQVSGFQAAAASKFVSPVVSSSLPIPIGTQASFGRLPSFEDESNLKGTMVGGTSFESYSIALSSAPANTVLKKRAKRGASRLRIYSSSSSQVPELSTDNNLASIVMTTAPALTAAQDTAPSQQRAAESFDGINTVQVLDTDMMVSRASRISRFGGLVTTASDSGVAFLDTALRQPGAPHANLPTPHMSGPIVWTATPMDRRGG